MKYGFGPWLLQWMVASNVPLATSPAHVVALPMPFAVTFMPSALSWWLISWESV